MWRSPAPASSSLEAPAAPVDESVVGHHRLGRLETELGEEAQAPLERANVGVGVFAWVQLDVGDPASGRRRRSAGGRSRFHGADPCVERSPVTRWPGTLKRASFFTSMCSSAPGTRPLVAAIALSLPAWPPREAVAVKHLPDRRARSTDDAGQSTRTEIRLTASTQDRLFLRRTSADVVGASGRDERSASAEQTAATVQPAMPPAVRRRRRDAEARPQPPSSDRPPRSRSRARGRPTVRASR